MLDLETTGLSPDAEIVEVAVVAANGTLVLQELIRPTAPVPAEATAIHGLDDSTLSASPVFEIVYPRLAARVDRTTVAYNAAFDQAVLDRTCATHHRPPLATTWTCALEAYTAWRGFSAPLAVVCEIEGIDTPPQHRAAADALAVWHLIRRMGGHR